MSAEVSAKCIEAVERWPDMSVTCSATSRPWTAIWRTCSASAETRSISGSTRRSTFVTTRTTRPTTTATTTIAAAMTTNETATTTITQKAGSFVLICKARGIKLFAARRLQQDGAFGAALLVVVSLLAGLDGGVELLAAARGGVARRLRQLARAGGGRVVHLAGLRAQLRAGLSGAVNALARRVGDV